MSGMNEELDQSWINCSNTRFQVRLDWNYPASDLELEEFLETKIKTETGSKVTIWFRENNPMLLATSTVYILRSNPINVKIVCHHTLIMPWACMDAACRLQVHGICKTVTQTANMTQTRLRKEQNSFYWWYLQYSERIAPFFCHCEIHAILARPFTVALPCDIFSVMMHTLLYQKGKKLIKSFTNTREICNK